jgi:hypothetical protein
MVVIAGEVGGQILDARGDFQQSVSEAVGLRFGNGRLVASARNPFGSAALVWRFDWRGNHFHKRKIYMAAAGGKVEMRSLHRGRVARRDFPKRRDFFFQGEANECGHGLVQSDCPEDSFGNNHSMIWFVHFKGDETISEPVKRITG